MFTKSFLILFGIIFSLVTLWRVLFNLQLGDFEIYYKASQLIINHQSPYINSFINYPPSSFFLFIPFSLFPYIIAERIWTIFSLACLLVSIYLILKRSTKKVIITDFLLIYGLAFLSFPIKFNFGMGQVNLVILLLLTASFFYYRLSKSLISGILLGLASVIKIFPVFLLLFYIRKKQFRIVFSSVVTIILVSLLGFFAFGPQNSFDYLYKVIPNIPTIGNNIYYNQAFTGWLARLNVSNEISRILNIAVLILLLSFSFFTTKPKSSSKDLLEYSLFILVTLISGGLAWQHHFVLTLFPFTAIFLYSKDHKLSKYFVLGIITAYLLISWNIKNPNAFNGFLLSHVFFGALLLYLLIVQIIRGYANRG